jgi:hypothetical protein
MPAVSRLALLILSLAALPAAAMQFVAEPPFIHLSGHVEKLDWPAWQEAMKLYAGKVDTVVFHDSSGGNANTGERIGYSIRDNGLRTVVAGRCISSCANMFLGGKVRQFASSDKRRDIVLGYHGRYNHTTNALVTKNTHAGYFSTLTDGKMDDGVIDRFTHIEKKSGALLLAHPKYGGSQHPATLFCTGDEVRALREEQCERPKGVDALAIGVVTTWDLANVSVTPKPKKQATGTSKSWQ